MLGGGHDEDAVGEPVAESRDRPLAQERRDRGTGGDVERELNPAVGGVDALTTWPARPREPPTQLTGGDGHPWRDDKIGHDIGHAFDYPGSAATSLLAGIGRRYQRPKSASRFAYRGCMLVSMMTDDACYLALSSRDPRFDGWFFAAVLTTGIYCRPSCPAMTPKRSNVRFLPTAAAAQEAGFRACKRCRPDAVPGSPEWNVRADLVGRAMRHIADGVVDREGVAGLARRLGYSERHVNRQLVAEVGAGPIALARAQRSQTARLLLETTEVPIANVAFAAGFASVRQFNDTVREVFALTPTQLRASRKPASRTPTPGALHLRLPFRRPFAPTPIFEFLTTRAVPGVEQGSGSWYRRTLGLTHGSAIIELGDRAGSAEVWVKQGWIPLPARARRPA